MIVRLPTDRDIYANLLRDSRGLRRDQSSARDEWYAKLPWEQKEQTLFELEMLLKGLACFGNTRNHPGPRLTSPVAHDFLEELHILRDGIGRVNALVKSLLGDRERAYTFSRYLSSVLPEDSARGQLLKEQLTQDTPEEALFVLRNAFASFADLSDGVLRNEYVPNRLYAAIQGIVAREIGRNAFFNPLMSLEFRPEFDRIRNDEVLESLQQVDNEAAHRVVALTMLSLFRVLRYLDLIDRYAADPSSARRSYLVLAVMRSDLRALTRYLGRHAADAIANGFERDLMSIHAHEIMGQSAQLGADAHRLSIIRNALEATANGLRVDVRKLYLLDLPTPSEGISGSELGPSFVAVAASLRASVNHGIVSLCGVLAPSGRAPELTLDGPAKSAAGERLRREVWMFMQILRAFIAKAHVASPTETAVREREAGTPDRWDGATSFQFVRDFLSHFRAIGFQLLRANDYARLDPFMAALEELSDVDLVDPARLRLALSECHVFYEFLENLFQQVSQRADLANTTFDRKDATETLKIYLGQA